MKNMEENGTLLRMIRVDHHLSPGYGLEGVMRMAPMGAWWMALEDMVMLATMVAWWMALEGLLNNLHVP